ncbi:unnamed protein product [Lupinus luteus]|uniref:Senescence-associated protein n=1 Tax=Lupinus luteus TaxID=3873 RepID=A0AAV1VYD9_LUPLU
MPLIIGFTRQNLPAGSSYPEGNFGGNQLLDGSISLSPYTQVRRTICTSVSLRASTRVSPGFAPLRHSSPSFGSRQLDLGPPSQFASVHAPSRLAERLSPFHIRPRHIAGPIRFPPDNFKHSLTLFSKSFSSFPHAPRGAIGSRHDEALTLSGAPFQGTWARSATEDASPDYNLDTEGDRFSWWAFPGGQQTPMGIKTDSRGRTACEASTMILPQLFVFHKSKNFTSDYEIRMPPTVPVNHYSDPEGQHNKIRILWCYPMLMYPERRLALSTLISSKINQVASINAFARRASVALSNPPTTSRRGLDGTGHKRHMNTTQPTAQTSQLPLTRPPVRETRQYHTNHSLQCHWQASKWKQMVPPDPLCRARKEKAHASSWCGSALRASPNTTPFHSEKGPTGNRYAEVHQFFIGKTAQHFCMRHTPPHLNLNHENQPQTHFRMIGLPRLPVAAVPLRGSPNTSSFRGGRVTLEASEHPWDAANTNSTPRDQTGTKGSIGHAFTVRIRTGNQTQTSFYHFLPHEIFVLVELILGHLRYLLTDVPPQPNSPPDNVFRPDRPIEAGLGSKNRGCAPPPIHGISKITLKVVVFHFITKSIFGTLSWIRG